jgi:hypothetical protein
MTKVNQVVFAFLLITSQSAKAGCMSKIESNAVRDFEILGQESATHQGKTLKGCLLKIKEAKGGTEIAYSRWASFCQKDLKAAKARVERLCCDAGFFPPPCGAKGTDFVLPSLPAMLTPAAMDAAGQKQVREELRSSDFSTQQAILAWIENAKLGLPFRQELSELVQPGVQVDIAAQAARILLPSQDQLPRETLIRSYFRYSMIGVASSNPVDTRKLESLKLTPTEESWFIQDDFDILLRERSAPDAARFVQIFSQQKLGELFGETFKYSFNSGTERCLQVLLSLASNKVPASLIASVKKFAEGRSETAEHRALSKQVYCHLSGKKC